MFALNKQVEANDLLPINALGPSFKAPQVAYYVREEGWDLAGLCIFYFDRSGLGFELGFVYSSLTGVGI